MTPRPATGRMYVLPVISLLLVVALAVGAVPRALAEPGSASALAGDPPGGPPGSEDVRSSASAGGSVPFDDVPARHWAKGAIRVVAVEHKWMRDFGLRVFKPRNLESRRRFARAVVRAFAPNAKVDPSIRFVDLKRTDSMFRYANVAVKLGWMGVKHDRFRPTRPVTMMHVHRAIVRALGLGRVARGADRIHTADGKRLKHRVGFGTLLLGRVLGLRRNHEPKEYLDTLPNEPLSRAEVAWSLARANLIETEEPWHKTEAAAYADIKLGTMPWKVRRAVVFALRYVGHPYVYAGEWGKRTPSGYCCGAQAVGGFDCSGLMWWVLRKADSMYDNTSVRRYEGWRLPERSSNDMAFGIRRSKRLSYAKLRPGDLMFQDATGDGRMDHVNLYLGWGWALDSGSNGVTLVKVHDGWYRDYFTWGRRIIN